MEGGLNSLTVEEKGKNLHNNIHNVTYFSGGIPFELSTSITISTCSAILFEKAYATRSQLVSFSTNLNGLKDL